VGFTSTQLLEVVCIVGTQNSGMPAFVDEVEKKEGQNYWRQDGWVNRI
jgi:hypothetical protein